MIKKFGCTSFTIYPPRHPHDFISIPTLTKVGISEKTSELYAKGLSTRAIANELCISKTAVNGHLKSQDIPLRSHSNSQLSSSNNVKVRSIKTAPYGYCLLEGKLYKSPKEQSTLKIILLWASQGMSHCSIARELSKQKNKSRKAAKWSQPTIGLIIKRHNKK